MAARGKNYQPVHAPSFRVCPIRHLPLPKLLSQLLQLFFRTHLLEYSLSMASVISIGHISTTHLAAATLGSMTASVSLLPMNLHVRV